MFGQLYPLNQIIVDHMNLVTSPRLLEERSLFVVFTGRLGGSSAGTYDSLNLSFRMGDNPDDVRTNRQRLAEAVGLSCERIRSVKQVHGADILSAVENSPLPSTSAGDEAASFGNEIGEADGLVTDQPGTGLLLQFADCVPVAIFDTSKKIAMGLHAGRAGVEQGIVGKGVGLLAERWGSRPQDLAAFIGPSIGPCCYEVDEAVATAFTAATAYAYAIRPSPGEGARPRLDLWSAVQDQLVRKGVPAEAIANPRMCTSCNVDRYFSHRAEKGNTGRQGMIVGLAS